MIKVTTASKVPKTYHYAILIYSTDSIYYEADERSKTCPGHGYPAYSEDYTTFEHYIIHNKDEWENEIGRIMKKKENFVAFSCR